MYVVSKPLHTLRLYYILSAACFVAILIFPALPLFYISAWVGAGERFCLLLILQIFAGY